MSKETGINADSCRDLLDRLIDAACEDIDEIKRIYSEKEIGYEELKDLKWSGSVMMTEAYFASIALSLATIADCMTLKGEKDEETDRD